MPGFTQPTQVITSVEGIPFFLDFQGSSDAPNEQTLIEFTISVGKARNFTQLLLITRHPGIVTIKSNDVIIGSGRTGASHQNVPLFWSPARKESSGKVIKVLFKGLSGNPNQPLEAYLMGTEVDI